MKEQEKENLGKKNNKKKTRKGLHEKSKRGYRTREVFQNARKGKQGWIIPKILRTERNPYKEIETVRNTWRGRLGSVWTSSTTKEIHECHIKNGTISRVLKNQQDTRCRYFYWSGMKQDIKFCKTCNTCKMVGKPNMKIPPAPLKSIPIFDEPFSKIIVDCIGPLPKTKEDNTYILIILCSTTRFP